MKRVHIKITFVTPVLGTGNSNPEIHREFIASKAPDAKSREEEVAAIGVDAAEEKATTVFSRMPDGTPMLLSHQIKGFFKESCGHLQTRMKGEKCSKESCKLKSYKKVIDGTIFPMGNEDYDRKIPLHTPEGWEPGNPFQRPLRGQTAQGERIAIASSEILPEDTWCEFWVETPDAYVNALNEWLTYGRKHGIGQWRNGDYGRFVFEVLDTKEV